VDAEVVALGAGQIVGGRIYLAEHTGIGFVAKGAVDKDVPGASSP